MAAEADHFEQVLGASVAWRIEAFGARVAMVHLGDGPPLLLADHIEGDRPVLVYRVPDLDAELAELEGRGWRRETAFGIPPGPCCELHTPGGHRIAIYEPTRPGVVDGFEGRRDF